MNKVRPCLIAVLLLAWTGTAWSQTILTAKTGTPTLDGTVEGGEWTSDPLVTTAGVTLNAMADGEYLYVAAQWEDATENVNKRRWQYDGAGWARGPEDEDRIGFIWDMGLNGSDGVNCTAMCHGDKMYTNNGLVDVWHWKAARGNAAGYVDGKHWDTEDRKSDPGKSAYVENNTEAGIPAFMAANDPGANVDYLADVGALATFDPFGTMAAHSVAEAVAFDTTATFTAGDEIPWYLMRPSGGDRGSVQSAGKWENGVWTVEFRRPYNGGSASKTQSEFDFDVVPGSMIDFTHEIFDNTGGGHPDDGFDATVYTLDLTEIPANTTLVATAGSATMDGEIGDGEYTSVPLVTANGVTLTATADGEFLYIAAHWADSTENIDKRRWQYDGAAWSRGPEDEDRIGFIWDMGLNGADGVDCTTMCHGDKMYTNNGLVDVWHWKAARGNAAGYVDGKHWDTEDRQSDPGRSAYVDNNTASGTPAFMASNDPGANVDYLADVGALATFDPFGTMAAHTVAEAVPFDSTAVFAAGDEIPWYLMRESTGDRGSVQSAGKWEDGYWTVEFKRPYVGGTAGKTHSEFDFDVIPGTTIDFSHEIFDNTGGGHPNDGWDETIYTLDLSNIPVGTPSGTTLFASRGEATMDGKIDPGEYSAPPLVTANDVTLYAQGDGEFLYLAAHWQDDTENFNKRRWRYDGSTWVRGPEDEDRIGFIWDMGLNGSDGANCTTMCHGDKMYTNVGFVDVWHWKAARGNGAGYVDGKHWDTEDRQSDPGTSAYVENNADGSPAFMAESDPGANVDYLADIGALAAFDPFGALAAHTVAEAVPFDSTAVFAVGDEIPWYLMRPSTGDRGSVQAAGRWEDGWWTVEFKRAYAGGAAKTQSEFDFDVVPGGTVDFTHEIFDNTGGGHPDDGFDATIYTLDMTGLVTTATEPLAGDLPASFVLKQNYPNPFNPSTKIEFHVANAGHVTLAVYDLLGKRVATLADEELAVGTYRHTFAADGLPSGVYFYRIEMIGWVKSRMMTLLK